MLKEDDDAMGDEYVDNDESDLSEGLNVYLFFI